MMNNLRQQTFFDQERIAWEALSDEQQRVIQQLLSRLMEQELASSTEQPTQIKEPDDV